MNQFILNDYASSPTALNVTAVGGSSQEAVVGQVVSLNFAVSPSVSAQNIELTFKGNNISSGGQIPFLSVSADRLSVTLNPAIPSHEGVYVLTATTQDNSNSASISLEILGKLPTTARL